MAEFGRVERNLDTVKDERRRLGDPAPSRGQGYEAWRERTAIDERDRANVWDGERERAYIVDTLRFEFAARR